MSFAFHCTECGRELKTDERHAGRRVRCPDCASLLVVPDPDSVAAKAEQQVLEEPDEETDDLEIIDDFELLEPIDETEEFEAVAEPPVLVIAPRPTAPPRVTPKRARQTSGSSAEETAAMLRPKSRQPEDLIDMTAMVDIVFFLLIFFLVTSLQALEAVMNMPTPQSESGGAGKVKTVADYESDPAYIVVRIEDDDSIWVEDTQVFNDQDLRVKLKAARQEGGKPRSLLVIGDADASHGAAVRVFDAGAGAGVDNISFLVQEKSAGGP